MKVKKIFKIKKKQKKPFPKNKVGAMYWKRSGF